jgi:Sel1 repeat.
MRLLLLFLLLLFITSSSSVIAGSSLYERGKVYYYGSAESAIDYEKAFNIFEHASKTGDLDAKTALGVMHIEGKGTHQDDQKRCFNCWKRWPTKTMQRLNII